MKQSLKLIAYYFIVILICVSCKKDPVNSNSSTPGNPTPPVNPPPVDCLGPYTNRPTINAQLIPFATLSEAREGIAVATAGTKIVFAGASSNGGQTNPSRTVDIFDINTKSWSIAELSESRQDFSVVTSGTKFFFAGGWEGNWWEDPTMFTTVDIYDAANDSWSVKHLGEARAWVGSASAGNKVFFAGGINNNLLASSKVEIYDTQTNSWSTSSLSEPRSNISTQIAGNKIHFAGGSNGLDWTPRATVDVYDINTGLWTVSSMNEPKSNMKSYATGSKIIWAGGQSINNRFGYTSAVVEIKDVNTQGSSFSCLHEPREWLDNDQKAVIKNNHVVFFTGYLATNKFDIYDTVSNSWSIGVLNQNIVGAAVIAVNNTIYVAGGYVNGSLSNVVWKLEF